MISPVGIRNDKVLDYSIMMLGCTDLNTLAALPPSPWDMHQCSDLMSWNWTWINLCSVAKMCHPAKLHKSVVLERVVGAETTSSWGRVFALIWNYLKRGPPLLSIFWDTLYLAKLNWQRLYISISHKGHLGLAGSLTLLDPKVSQLQSITGVHTTALLWKSNPFKSERCNVCTRFPPLCNMPWGHLMVNCGST